MASPITMARDVAEPAGELATAVEARRYMIVTANPLASEAGAKILKRGGSAVDAMIAAQAVLGLVEPQSSGIGGGAFVVYYDARKDELTTFDAREKAPAAATGDRFARFSADGGGGFLSAWQSGLSVGVPGIPRLLEELHFRYGKKPFRSLMRPARRLARNGFPLTQRTSDQVAGLLERNESCHSRLFFRDEAAYDYFVNTEGDTCAAKPAGTIITNSDYAHTLGTFGRGGDSFYTGDIAADIVDAVRTDQNVPGDMTLEDLANYEVIERQPVCIDYRGHDVCGMGPPSSGALAVAQILGIMENFDVERLRNRAGRRHARQGLSCISL